jgi:hypothetical protein
MEGERFSKGSVSVLGGARAGPPVPCDVGEDCDLTVGLASWFGDELDALAQHSRVSRVEVIDSEEQPDTAGELISHCGRLPFAIGLRQQHRACRSGRTYDDPPFRPSVIGLGWRVLYEFEAQGIDEEPDGVVIVVNDQGELLEVHASQGITSHL